MTAALACIGGLAAHRVLRDQRLISRSIGPRQTPYGESQPISVVESAAGAYYFLARFGEMGHPVAPRYVNPRANLYALKTLNVCYIASWTESKAVSHNYRVGDFVMIDDLIDESVTPPTSFFETLDLAHVRQWPVFCPTLREHYVTALMGEDLNPAERGVFVAVEGHRQETPAEVRKYASYGGDLIGRALAPEAFLAKELELSYACACYVAQYAEHGSSARPFERGQVLDEASEARMVDEAVKRMPAVMERLLRELQAANRIKPTPELGVHLPEPNDIPASFMIGQTKTAARHIAS